jgi:hypothetical protein
MGSRAFDDRAVGADVDVEPSGFAGEYVGNGA